MNKPVGRAEPALKKRLGQHHLVRADLCEPLVRFLDPHGRRVIEIGPGGGVLTRLLVERGARLLALELDPQWAFTLTRRSREVHGRLAVVDAMKVEWNHLAKGSLVTGNLPYQIGSSLVARLLPLHDRIPRMGFLVQLEVAQRLVARPGSRDYGALSVLSLAFSDARLLGRVAPGSFRPPPQVTSAFVGFSLKAPPLSDREMPAFISMVRLAFGQRRKTLRNALASEWGREKADAVIEAAGFDGTIRAEQVDLEGFVRLYREQTGA